MTYRDDHPEPEPQDSSRSFDNILADDWSMIRRYGLIGRFWAPKAAVSTFNAFLPYASKPSTTPCNLCHSPVAEFTIPNDVWNKVMRPDGHEGDHEYICIDCWYNALRTHLK